MPRFLPHHRITPIDSLRGIAALCVVDYHFYFFTGVQPSGGYLWVDFFFILSGIVLTHVYEHKIVQRQIKFRHFFVNRLARLYPLHLLTFLIMLGITLIVIRHEALLEIPLLVKSTALNLLLLQNVGLTSYWPIGNVPSWSISTEIVINLVWFYFLVHLRRTTLWFTVSMVIALTFLLLSQGSVCSAPCCNVFVILIPACFGV